MSFEGYPLGWFTRHSDTPISSPTSRVQKDVDIKASLHSHPTYGKASWHEHSNRPTNVFKHATSAYSNGTIGSPQNRCFCPEPASLLQLDAPSGRMRRELPKVRNKCSSTAAPMQEMARTTENFPIPWTKTLNQPNSLVTSHARIIQDGWPCSHA